MDGAEKYDMLAMVRDGEIISSDSPLELRNYYNIDRLEEVFLKARGGNDENNRVS